MKIYIVLDVGESVIMPEWIGHDSAHKLLLSFIVVGVVTVGGSSVTFFTDADISAAGSLTSSTISLQLMLQVGVMASVVVGTVVVLLWEVSSVMLVVDRSSCSGLLSNVF